MSATIEQLAAMCKGSVTVEVNPHRNCYESVTDHLLSIGWDQTADDMIAADRIITLQFYPDTSIGSYLLCGAQLQPLLDTAMEIIRENACRSASSPEATK